MGLPGVGGVQASNLTVNRLLRALTSSSVGDAGISDDGSTVAVISGRAFNVVGNATVGGTIAVSNAGGGDSLFATSSAAFTGLRLTVGSQVWALRASTVSASVTDVTNSRQLTTWHASGGISLLDATDPGAGVVRVAGALTVTGRITGSNGLRLTSGGFQRPDDAGLALLLGNGTNEHYGANHNFRDAAGSGWGNTSAGTFGTAGAASTGAISLIHGTASFSGYAQFLRPDGSRVGYIGFAGTGGGADTGTIPYVAGTHAFTGSLTISGALAVTGTPTFNSQSIHAAGARINTDQQLTYQRGAYTAGSGDWQYLPVIVSTSTPSGTAPENTLWIRVPA